MNHDKAVRLTRAYFKNLGYRVLAESGSKNRNGPDLTVIGKKMALRVEVKPVRRVKANCWQVRGVEPTRANDDLIAVVFPSGAILLEEMGQWIKTLAKDGSRGISTLGRIYNGSL